MSSYPLSDKKNQLLLHKMAALGIKETDLEESFIRSGGPGGQNVNKVSTCVVLKHVPTGTMVKCQRERSQVMNRYWARRILAEKIENEILGRESEEAKRAAKLRRQKKKRSRRAREKIFKLKKMKSEKKQLRTKIHFNRGE